MKSNRHRAREIAFQILYRYDLESQATGLPLPKQYALNQDLKSHFEHFEVSGQFREFAEALVRGTLTNLERIDQTIEACSANWKVSRMPFVDRNLLRMSTYELQNYPDTAPSITINEALEIAKSFGTSESAPFVNGILDHLAKQIRSKS